MPAEYNRNVLEAAEEDRDADSIPTTTATHSPSARVRCVAVLSTMTMMGLIAAAAVIFALTGVPLKEIQHPSLLWADIQRGIAHCGPKGYGCGPDGYGCDPKVVGPTCKPVPDGYIPPP